jgi:hypothetical protein
MFRKDAEAYFGGLAGIVKALKGGKFRSKSAVYQWGEVVPLLAACELQQLSGGVLQIDFALYKDRARTKTKSYPRKPKPKHKSKAAAA